MLEMFTWRSRTQTASRVRHCLRFEMEQAGGLWGLGRSPAGSTRRRRGVRGKVSRKTVNKAKPPEAEQFCLAHSRRRL